MGSILTILFTLVIVFGALSLMRFMLENIVGILFACFGFFLLLTFLGFSSLTG